MNKRAIYPGQRSFNSDIQTDTHIRPITLPEE